MGYQRGLQPDPLGSRQNINRIHWANLARFWRTVAELQLQDLHLHGCSFTWSNERENPTLVKLDRVLVSMDWEEMFPNCHLCTLRSNMHLTTTPIPTHEPGCHVKGMVPL